ncbi:MAG: cytidine deaminase [Myxococcales bacterium]|nr:cytidine deaminase [Myxococcales bacterium]
MPGVPWEKLFEAAQAARALAYAPYSEFRVGAAVLSEGGGVFAGCNVENASYGLSVCAERNAIARMVAEGRRRLLAVAIVVDTERPTPPCGMCRQVMAELGAPALPVRSRTLAGREARWKLAKLLPHAFTKRSM